MFHLSRQKNLRAGFTLIELMVVISIVATLASMMVATLNQSRRNANDAKRKAELNQMARALDLYYVDNDMYPIGDICTSGCASVSSLANWSTGNLASALVPEFLPLLPEDPINSGSFIFTYTTTSSVNPQSYTLCAQELYGGGNFCIDRAD